MTQLAQTTPAAVDHTAEIARLNDAARAGSLATSRTVFTRALADILAGDAEGLGSCQASLMLGHAVYVVKPSILALLRKPAPLRRQGPGAANPQGELFAA